LDQLPAASIRPPTAQSYPHGHATDENQRALRVGHRVVERLARVLHGQIVEDAGIVLRIAVNRGEAGDGVHHGQAARTGHFAELGEAAVLAAEVRFVVHQVEEELVRAAVVGLRVAVVRARQRQRPARRLRRAGLVDDRRLGRDLFELIGRRDAVSAGLPDEPGRLRWMTVLSYDPSSA
jgi:hypothetical protein